MTDAEFLAAFESCTLPRELWTHQAHVRVAYLYASQSDLPAATTHVRTSIKAYNKTSKTPDAIDRGYHETITIAFMDIVFAANVQTGPHQSSMEFCEAHPELLTKFALQQYYSKERLMTLEAKYNFVPPDLCPLPIAVSDSITIHNVAGSECLDHARALLTAYAESIPHDLAYQNFDDELRVLPGKYAPPKGRLLVALNKRQPAGCTAIRPLNELECEMKRLWVGRDFRGLGLGRVLAEAALDEARAIGYSVMRLDTVAEMVPAISLYRSLGFAETEPYTHNPLPGAIFMERRLDD